jgi:hypothetical protein
MPVAATADRPRREYLKVGLLAETVGKTREQDRAHFPGNADGSIIAMGKRSPDLLQPQSFGAPERGRYLPMS